jgi:hypothetical protein
VICGYCGEREADILLITPDGQVIAECAHCEALPADEPESLLIASSMVERALDIRMPVPYGVN